MKRPPICMVATNIQKKCEQLRAVQTGQSQYRGKVYCPGTESLSREQWLEEMRKKNIRRGCKILGNGKK